MKKHFLLIAALLPILAFSAKPENQATLDDFIPGGKWYTPPEPEKTLKKSRLQSVDGDPSKHEGARFYDPAPPIQPLPKELGQIDRWRYESCQQDAAKSPTELGVKVGLQLCRKKFGQ